MWLLLHAVAWADCPAVEWSTPAEAQVLVDALQGFRFQIHQLSLRISYRSHSPITKSSEPRIATTSEIRQPTQIFGRIDRLQKEGDRILRR